MAKRRHIAIVGASARAAAFSAIRAGLAPLAADLFADADLARVAEVQQVTRYPRGLAEWLLGTPPGTPWLYTGALENYPDLVDEMARLQPLWGCPGSILRKIRDPLQLAAVLADAQVPFPRTIRAAPSPLPPDWGGAGGEKLPTTPPFNLPTQWLLKTYAGSSGSGIRAWDGRRLAHRPDRPMYLQQRVAGRPGSAVFVASHGTAHLLGITRQLVGMAWTHAAEFQYAGSIGPWHLNVAAFEDVHRAGQALARLGLVGLFGIDFVLAADGRAWILEVNPRYTASVEVVERASGVGVMAWHVAAVSGDGSALASAASPPPSRRRGAGTIRESRARGEGGGTVCGHYGKAILFARQDVFVTTEFADWALERTAIPPRWPELADLPRGGTRIFAGRPVVTVFAEGTSKDDVENLLRQDAAEIEQRLLR